MSRNMINVMMGLFVAVAFGMSGCGGSGGGGGGGGGTVAGVAANGTPLVGIIKLKDAASPSKELAVVSAADGSFSFDVGGLTPPFILMANPSTGDTSQELHSFATGAGVANINPFVNLAISMASGGLDPATIYAAPNATILQTIATKLPASIADIQTQLQPLLTLYNATKSNPLTDTFTANHTGLDEVLDMTKVELTGGTVTIKSKTTNAVIVTGLPTAPASWTCNPAVIPVPPIRPIISPIYATVVKNQAKTFSADVPRSENKNMTWSVVETGGGTITSDGVYTAPANEGFYRVRVVAAANTSLPSLAIVKVVSGESVSVSINPTQTTIAPGGNTTFTATVAGTSITQVIWSVTDAGGGTITSAGVYTAPSAAGTYHIKAVSVSDTSKNATATVTVSTTSGTTPAPTTGTFPIGTWVGPHNIKFTVTGLVDTLGADKYYSGTVNDPAFAGGVVTVPGTIINATGAITLLQSGESLTVVVQDASAAGVTSFNFLASGLTTVQKPITSLKGLLIIVSSVTGQSYNEQATFVKQ